MFTMIQIISQDNLPGKACILNVDDFDINILEEGFEFFAEKKALKVME